MQWSRTRAIALVPGDVVSWEGVRKVASTHYSGDVMGTGVVTVIFTDAFQITVSANTPIRYIAD